MKHNIIFDLSIFIHSNFFIQQKLKNKGVINEHEFIKIVSNQIQNIYMDISKKYSLNTPVIAVDSKNFRKANFPEYKGTRDNTNKPQLSALKSFCAEYIEDHYESIRISMLEADDIMHLYSKKYNPCIIVSNDNDCQLSLKEGVIFYKYREKRYYNYDRDQFLWHKYHKVLFGDDGDNVKRLVPKGNSAKWFTQFFKENKELGQADFYKNCVAEFPEINPKDIVKNIHLTNYSDKIYRKYIPNFDEIYESI